MPRVLGVDIPGKKRVEYALRYIYGIGPASARHIVDELKIDPARKADELTDDEVARISTMLQSKYRIEGDLRREISQNIRRWWPPIRIAAPAIARASRCAASGPVPTRALARARARP